MFCPILLPNKSLIRAGENLTLLAISPDQKVSYVLHRYPPSYVFAKEHHSRATLYTNCIQNPAHAPVAHDTLAYMRNALTFTTSIKFAYMLTVFACLPVIAHASSVCPFTWERNLTIGMHGDDVRALQRFLNADNHTRIAAHGAGSPGAESSYFGLATKRALSIFQEKYASDILIPSGITKGSGIFGIATRQKLHAICSTVSNTDMSTNTQTAAVAAVETVMLRIGTTTQPAASIAPHDALYVPFTTFTMTAQHGDITVRSVTVERVGPSHIGAFSYLSLLDEAGNELSYTYLHTDQKAVFSKPFIVHAGETKTLTIAGAMAADLSEYDDETATFALDAIDASAPVVGPLPVRGTFQKINASLQIGTASVTLSSYGPSVATTHTINDTSVRFSGIRITAGSQEDQILYAITWRQIGTINPSDIQNVRVIAGDTSAATDVDGRDYTANFPDGISEASKAV